MRLAPHHRTLLVLLATLALAGSGEFQCTNDKNGDNPSGGDSNVKIRVASSQKISESSGGFNGTLRSGDAFGSAVADLGDLESDGVTDLVAGAPYSDDNGTDRGEAWVLFMETTGRVDQEQSISDSSGGFGGNLHDGDRFASALAGIGDLNGDGVFDFASGVPGNDDGGNDRGGLWIVFLDAQGRVVQQQKIADSTGGFTGNLHNNDRFGSAVTRIGDLDGDGITELAVGSPEDDEGADDAGAVWILFMGMDGRVTMSQKIARNTGGFGGNLESGDNFGAALAGIGDLDGDGIPDLAVGAPGADSDKGAVWILFLDAGGKVREQQKIADGSGGFKGTIDRNDAFGSALAATGDLDGDGVADIGAGAPYDDDGHEDAGAVWILLMETTGRVAGWQKLSADAGGFNGNLDANDHFGAALAGIGDLDNSGLPDLAVGTPGDDSGTTDQGAVWILFMERRI